MVYLLHLLSKAQSLSCLLLLLPYLLWMLPLICYNFTVLMCIQCWNFPGHVSIFYKFHEYFLKLYYHCLVLLLLQQTMYLPILIINNTTLYTKLLSFPIPDHLVKCKKRSEFNRTDMILLMGKSTILLRASRGYDPLCCHLQKEGYINIQLCLLNCTTLMNNQ